MVDNEGIWSRGGSNVEELPDLPQRDVFADKDVRRRIEDQELNLLFQDLPPDGTE